MLKAPWAPLNSQARDASNVYPRKARPEQSFDAAVALIMGIACCMAAEPAR